MTQTPDPIQDRDAQRVPFRAWLLAVAIIIPIATALELSGIRSVAEALPSPRRDVFAHHYYQAARNTADTDRPKLFILGSSMSIRGLGA